MAGMPSKWKAINSITCGFMFLKPVSTRQLLDKLQLNGNLCIPSS